MIISQNPNTLASIMQQGGIIAYPTQAVFGLGCRADNETTINTLLQLKQRSTDKGFILLADTLERFEHYILPLSSSDKEQINQAKRATTWLVSAKATTSPLLTGKYSTLAIRITQHPATVALCKAVKHPIISTSANLSGKTPATTRQEIIDHFNATLDGLYDHSIGLAKQPSRIIDLATATVLRD